MEISMKEKIKALLTDSMWSIAGLMLMNVVVQFFSLSGVEQPPWQ